LLAGQSAASVSEWLDDGRFAHFLFVRHARRGSGGYECWGVEFLSQGRHSLLRVYIDQPDGVLVEDCEKVSRQISGVLDVEDPIASEYTLEVSSPGMDRPLFTLEQFAKHVGEQVKIKLRSPFDGRRNFQGLLRCVEEQDVVVLVDDHEYLLPIDLIDKANIIPRFD
jgi:ribosome maturation factor RimP